MSNKQELIDCTWKFNSRDAQDGLRVIRRSITGLGCEGDPRRTIAFVAEFIDLCDGDPKDALAQLEAWTGNRMTRTSSAPMVSRSTLTNILVPEGAKCKHSSFSSASLSSSV